MFYSTLKRITITSFLLFIIVLISIRYSKGLQIVAFPPEAFPPEAVQPNNSQQKFSS